MAVSVWACRELNLGLPAELNWEMGQGLSRAHRGAPQHHAIADLHFFALPKTFSYLSPWVSLGPIVSSWLEQEVAHS